MHQEFFDALKKDHREVLDMLEEIKNTSDGARKKKEDLFARLKMELVPHMKAEEKHFYSALKQKKEVRESALEGAEEHKVAETVLRQLDRLPKDDETWKAKLSVFKEIIEHHVEEEEEEIFQGARSALDEREIEQIMKSFEGEKEKIKKRIK